jgi:hypothetical protein
MAIERSRIRLVAGGTAFALTLFGGIRRIAGSDPLPGVTVYKSPT